MVPTRPALGYYGLDEEGDTVRWYIFLFSFYKQEIFEEDSNIKNLNKFKFKYLKWNESTAHFECQGKSLWTELNVFSMQLHIFF